MNDEPKKPIRIMLADDHHVVRTAVASYLTREPDIDVVGEAATGDAILPTLAQCQPDVLVLDAHMPGHKVLVTARQLREQFPAVNVLVLSGYTHTEYVVGLFREGARGYVLKNDEPQMLAQAIRAVASGTEWISLGVLPVLTESLRRNATVEAMHFSERQLMILNLVARGKTNREIADEVHLTEQTVKNQLVAIYKQLGVHNRVDATRWAMEHDLGDSAETEM